MRAFYKSRLFWLGVPGLVFLLWVWWDSGGYFSAVSYDRTPETWFVGVSEGCVTWTHSLDLKPRGLTMDGLRVDRHSLADEYGVTVRRHFAVAPAFEKEVETVGVPAWGLEMWFHKVRAGLWVVVLGYVMVWLGSVVWWERRKARVMREEEVC